MSFLVLDTIYGVFSNVMQLNLHQDAFVSSVTDDTPLGDYLDETGIPDLPNLLAGWRISVRLRDAEERTFAQGTGKGHLIVSVP